MNNDKEQINRSVELIVKAIKESGKPLDLIYLAIIAANEKLESELK